MKHSKRHACRLALAVSAVVTASTPAVVARADEPTREQLQRQLDDLQPRVQQLQSQEQQAQQQQPTTTRCSMTPPAAG